MSWTIVAYLLSAAAYELALALRHASSPGNEFVVVLVAVVAMLAGAALVFRPILATGLFAPAAALFVTARFYAGDPYYNYGYGSTFRRYADGGIFPPTWIYVLLGFALVAGAATLLWRRTAPVETLFALLPLAFTAFLMGAGH